MYGNEKLHFLHCSWQEALHDLINVLGPSQSFCNNEIFVKLNLPMFLVLVRTREKSQKYLNLLEVLAFISLLKKYESLCQLMRSQNFAKIVSNFQLDR